MTVRLSGTLSGIRRVRVPGSRRPPTGLGARRPATLGYAILLAEIPGCDVAGRQVFFEDDGILSRTIRVAEALLVHRAARVERTTSGQVQQARDVGAAQA